MRFGMRGLGADERGNVAVLFAMSLVPIVGLTGLAVDYHRTSAAQSHLQNAVDATALMIAKNVGTMDDEALEALAASHIATLTGKNYPVTGFDVDGGTVIITVASTLDTTLSNVLGIRNMNLAASSEATWGNAKLEVMLVLDSTGSMNCTLSVQNSCVDDVDAPADGSRIVEMKKAAGVLLDALESADDELVKVGVVTYNTHVHVGTQYWDQQWTHHWRVPGSKKWSDKIIFGIIEDGWKVWEGCVQDRNTPHDADDVQGPAYPAVRSCAGQLQPVLPLTGNIQAVRDSIGLMKGEGATNVTIGVAWGHTLLSNQAPFAEGTPWIPAGGVADDEHAAKVMILMTDGENTENAAGGTCLKTDKNGKCTQVNDIDSRTAAACEAVKAQGVRLIAVRLIDGNAELLRNCASQDSFYFDVLDTQDLVPTFRRIGEELSTLHLSS